MKSLGLQVVRNGQRAWNQVPVGFKFAPPRVLTALDSNHQPGSNPYMGGLGLVVGRAGKYIGTTFQRFVDAATRSAGDARRTIVGFFPASHGIPMGSGERA